MKLNLGCGSKKLPGFINIDIRKEVNPDLVADITKLTSFKENFVDLIYACHVIEHFDRYEVVKMMQRWHYLLKLNGILRLSVPDMEAVFAHYFYWKNLEDLDGFIWGGQKNEYDYHKSGWDYQTLAQYLEKAGFVNIKKWDWTTTHPHNYIDDYSQVYWPEKRCQYYNGISHPKGKLMSLNLQAQKVLYQ